MAKSTGNLVLLSDLLKEHSPAAIRLLLPDRGWPRGWDYIPEDLRVAAERLCSEAGRPTQPRGAQDAVRAAPMREFDIPTALNIAEETGGDSTGLVLHTLKLG